MPVVHLDAKKRARQSVRRAARNSSVKTRLKTQTRKLLGAIKGADKAEASTEYKATASLFDQAAAKGVIHKNAAARKKARMAKKLASIGTAPVKAAKATTAKKKAAGKAKKS